MTEVTQDAVSILEGLRTMAYDEMLSKGYYADPKVFDAARAAEGAPCGGHQACVVGSLMLSAGEGVVAGESTEYVWDEVVGESIPITRTTYDLPDAQPAARDKWLHQPGNEGLTLAYRTLDEVVLEHYEDVLWDADNEQGLVPLNHFDYAPEALFEVHLDGSPYEVVREIIIEMADRAIERLGGTPQYPIRSYLRTVRSCTLREDDE